MVGHSPIFREILRLIARMAACDAPVLLEGETGTGKELAARAIHYQSARKDRPFIPVNCGAIPDALIESELFGHRKGAFTDAKENQPGLITLAEGGTLFLDEVDALTPKGQVTLLRFLQDQEFRPLGARQVEHGNVRILAASNTSLALLVEQGAFRADLLYRLRILSLELAPLRERRGDLEALASGFLEACDRRFGLGAKTLHPDALAWMAVYVWPGNIRELENLLCREYLLSEGPVLRIEAPRSMPAPVQPQPGKVPGDLSFHRAKSRAMEAFERDFLVGLLDTAGGNVSLAAKLAGKERRSLGKLLKKHGLAAAATSGRAPHGVRVPA
ncbi:MAG: sigma-54 dependent transcriptional regulator [Holophagaceae bacterium]